MRRLRKILALFIIITLTQVSFASAAAVPAGVARTDFVDAITRMQSLSIMIGDPGGKFRPDDTIKRSEFAALAVKALGLNDSAFTFAGATRFSDVAAGHWATGYINVAASQGLITGYPDGSYRPDDTINYAEALTILARMLGYGPSLAGTAWPGSYVAKANEAGITNGVILDTTVGTSRGVVAKLLSNTLDLPLVGLKSGTGSGTSAGAVTTLQGTTFTLAKLLEERATTTKSAIATTSAAITATAAAIAATGTAITSTDAAIDTETAEDDPSTSSSSHHHHHHNNDSDSPTVPTFTVTGNSVHNGGDTVTLTFSEAMDTSTLTEDEITLGSGLWLYYSTDGVNNDGPPATLARASAVWAGNTVLTLTLNETNDHTYIPADKFLGVTLFTGLVKSAAGVAAETSEVFSAGAAALESTDPGLTACTITTGAITLTFDDVVDASTLTMSGVTLSKGAVTLPLTGSSSTNSGFTNTITITLGASDESPINSLGFYSGASVILSVGAVKDLAGNGCKAHAGCSFTP